MDTPAAKAVSAELNVIDLGLISYPDAWDLQSRLREARIAGEVPDTLLLLEHLPTITIGRGGKADGILAAPQTLASKGIQVFPTERGGQVTYHGPGQVVGYTLFDLQGFGCDVHDFVRTIEQALIDALQELSITARRVPKLPGVWVGERKIAAIGIHIKRWVAMHGFALNVNPDLEAFSLIVPCGITEREVTSIHKELGWSPSIQEAKALLARQVLRHFSKQETL